MLSNLEPVHFSCIWLSWNSFGLKIAHEALVTIHPHFHEFVQWNREFSVHAGFARILDLGVAYCHCGKLPGLLDYIATQSSSIDLCYTALLSLKDLCTRLFQRITVSFTEVFVSLKASTCNYHIPLSTFPVMQ